VESNESYPNLVRHL